MTDIKGAVAYKFPEEVDLDTILSTITEEVLSEKEFQPCGKNDLIKVGFKSFSDGSFLLETAKTTAVQITTQTKKVHAEELKRKCKVAEDKYKIENSLEELDKETKEIIKHSMIEEMLPSTPAGKEETVALWVTGNTLTVGVASHKKGEEAVATLRNVIGSLPVFPVEVVTDVTAKLTSMVQKEYHETIVLADKVEMVGEDGKSIITFARGSVYDADTKQHIAAGAVVNKLQLEYDGAVTFTINQDLELSGLKVAKDVLCGVKDEGALIVTMFEIDKVIKELVEVFGGLKGE